MRLMRVETEGIEEVLEMFDRLDANRMAIKAVDAATPTLKESLKKRIKAAANRKDKKGRPYSKGDLANSVISTKAKINQYGVFAAVLVRGKDRKGMRNAEKLAYLEYGVQGKQEPRPVLQKAVNDVEGKCISIMEDIIEEEVDKM